MISLDPSTTAVRAFFNSACSCPSGIPSAGNKSLINERNNGTSCATSFDRFMSLNVLIRSASSGSFSLRHRHRHGHGHHHAEGKRNELGHVTCSALSLLRFSTPRGCF